MPKGCNYRGCSNDAQTYHIWMSKDGQLTMNNGLCLKHGQPKIESLEGCIDGAYYIFDINNREDIDRVRSELNTLTDLWMKEHLRQKEEYREKLSKYKMATSSSNFIRSTKELDEVIQNIIYYRRKTEESYKQ